ncbi:MAG: MutS N-terminal domain-containing protein [Chloroflexota bacterium]
MVEALRRHAELKSQHPDTILFFRMGDFYEAFGDDARVIARALQVTLTSRPTGGSDRIAMAGSPHYSIDLGIARLLAHGHKVAVAEHIPNQPPERTDAGPQLSADRLPAQLLLPL